MTKRGTERAVSLEVEPYLAQLAHWPSAGRHILAQSDESSIVVYQAYRNEIADHAIEHQRFGGEFSYARMSWIKPNFLWMMFRCGWATKDGQQRVLAIRLERDFFDALLAKAVPSSHVPALHPTRDAWQDAVARSDVRLQWDPDHDPQGRPLQRRALQLGLRGEALRRFGHEALAIEDVTSFVEAERPNARDDFVGLRVPRERVYASTDAAAANVGIDAFAP